MENTIRLASADDGEEIRAIYEPHVQDSAVSFEPTPPSIETVAQRIIDTVESHPWLVYERDDAVLGYAYAGPHRSRDAYRWAVESSVYVRRDHQRAGIARGLYESLFEVLELQGFRRVYAGTSLPNPASVGFHESMGFEPIGVYDSVGYKNGKWHDVKWWQRSLGEHTAAPDPPLPIPEARERERWHEALAIGQPSIRR
jgi:phosphinothricin acetyltransferase